MYKVQFHLEVVLVWGVYEPAHLLWYLLCRMGAVTLELYWKHAPSTCRNFAELARRGYYNGVKFHRIIKDFMIQGGDPTGTGKTFAYCEMFYLFLQDRASLFKTNNVISKCFLNISNINI